MLAPSTRIQQSKRNMHDKLVNKAESCYLEYLITIIITSIAFTELIIAVLSCEKQCNIQLSRKYLQFSNLTVNKTNMKLS